MDDPIIYQALLGLFVIFFIVTAVLSGKTLKVLHVLLLVSLFLAGGTFFIFSAITLNTHDSWRSMANKMKKQVAGLLHDVDLLADGPLAVSEKELAALEEESGTRLVGIRQVQQSLDHILLERGRLWHGSGEVDGLKATVTISRPAPTGIRPNTILYAFEEAEDGSYVGEFKVTSVEGNTVNMESTIDYDESQQEKLSSHDGDWILREMMPIDNHRAFAGMDGDELKKYLPEDNATLIDEYLKDGQTVTDADSDRVQIRVRMTTGVSDLPIERIDRSGKKETVTVSLKKGDLVLVSQEMAKILISEHGAEEPEKVYVRRLRRYEFSFHDIHRQQKMIADRIAQIKLQTANVVAATAKVEQVKTARTTERDDLQSDLDQVKIELAEVTKYRDALLARTAKLKSSVGGTYKKNNRLARELAALQLKMGSEISRRTMATTGPSGS